MEPWIFPGSMTTFIFPKSHEISKAYNCHLHQIDTLIFVSLSHFIDLQNPDFIPFPGIICGSGLGGLADLLTNSEDMEYTSIPGFPVSTG